MSNRGHDTDPSYFLACGAGFLAICTVVVAARFYTRIGQKARIGIDDWLTLPALVCTTAFLLYSDFGIGEKLRGAAKLFVICCGITFIVGKYRDSESVASQKAILIPSAGVKDKAFAYPTPPPSNPVDPSDSKSYDFTTVEQVSFAPIATRMFKTLTSSIVRMELLPYANLGNGLYQA